MKWYENPACDNGIVISSRVRLARNLKNYLFPALLGEVEASEMINEVSSSVKNDKTVVGERFTRYDLDDKPETYLHELLEKHIISPELLKKKNKKSVLLMDDEAIGIMLNQEDHIRIQTITSGQSIGESFSLANNVDDLIEESVEYAFDDELGYLTACPTNTGTGLRASYMLHLPMLEMTGRIGSVLLAINKFGMAVRGIYGEGTEPLGSIYQLSNQITLGKSESEITEGLESVMKKIVEQETIIRERFLAEKKDELEDKFYRSYGILRNARRISAPEAMSLLSEVRLGYLMGLIDEKRPSKTFYNLMMDIQPGSTMNLAGIGAKPADFEAVRAEYIRSAFSS